MVNWSYITNKDNSARYSLGKIGSKLLFCIGINPSTATPADLDHTLKRVDVFAFQKGYDGWIMLNVYPQRSTDPRGIHLEMDEMLHRQNIQTIKKLIAAYKKADVWAAWGTEIERRGYLISCLRDLAEVIGPEKNWLRLNALTKSGHPSHPSRLPNNSEFETFDIRGYLRNR